MQREVRATVRPGELRKISLQRDIDTDIKCTVTCNDEILHVLNAFYFHFGLTSHIGLQWKHFFFTSEKRVGVGRGSAEIVQVVEPYIRFIGGGGE